ncbi:MAG: DNA-binding NarL/FixJ family response regulator [Motiliproteus sp.]|jgi:DNA-binding NarL/FixJ family response regulator
MLGKLSSKSVPICQVMIVDDHPAVREGLMMRINQQLDLNVCAEASGVQEALQLLGQCQPDVAVIDISLKDGNGIDLIQRIKATKNSVRILVWSMHSDNLYAERALRAGALGYINKENTTGQLVEAIRSVSHDELCFSPETTQRILHGSLTNKGQKTLTERLSNRELEVFKMIGEGLKTSVIAHHLCISVHTVETHRQRIKTKLSLGSATELTTRAARWIVEEG